MEYTALWVVARMDLEERRLSGRGKIYSATGTCTLFDYVLSVDSLFVPWSEPFPHETINVPMALRVDCH